MTHRRTRINALLLATSLVVTLPAVGSLAPARAADKPNASFNLIGHIEKFTLDDIASVFSPATITVRGIDVRLPNNIQVVMPGQYLTPQQLFKGQTDWLDAEGKRGSGLALTDIWMGTPQTAPSMRMPFEAEVIGNIVNGQYIAGVAHISQGSLHAGAGFIQSINAVTGELRVGAKVEDVPGGAPNGARVVLNDAEGVYGPANASPDKQFMKIDDRFGLDSGNSPVHARTGFPVCAPATDAAGKCPASNRESVGLNKRFTCGTVEAANTIPAHLQCDPAKPVPLAVGDYITYLGMLTQGLESQGSANKVFRIAAHSIEAELGIYTSPGADPAYLFIEEALQGTKGERFEDPAFPAANPPALIPSEETTRFRIVGFTTDPSRQIKIEIFDEGSVGGQEGAGIQPAHPGELAVLSPELGMPTITGGQFGRFRGTWPSKDDARAVRRESRVSIIGGNVTQGPGWTTSQYAAPIGEYIYPEPTAYGNPGYMLPVPFESFCFLSQGKWATEINGALISMEPLGKPSAAGATDLFPYSGHRRSQQIGRTTLAPRVCGEP